MATMRRPSVAAAAAALAAVLLLLALLATPSTAQKVSGMLLYKRPSCGGRPVPFLNCNACFEVPVGTLGYRYMTSGRKAVLYAGTHCSGKSTAISLSPLCKRVSFKSFKIACRTALDDDFNNDDFFSDDLLSEDLIALGLGERR